MGIRHWRGPLGEVSDSDLCWLPSTSGRVFLPTDFLKIAEGKRTSCRPHADRLPQEPPGVAIDATNAVTWASMTPAGGVRAAAAELTSLAWKLDAQLTASAQQFPATLSPEPGRPCAR